MSSIENETDSPKVIEFLTIANEYSRLSEEAAEYPAGHIKAFLQRILPLLYLKGSLLPAVTPQNPEHNERFVTEEEWEDCMNRYKDLFGKDNEYWDVEYAESNEPEMIKRSIAEDLADIYQETKDFVLLYQKPLTASRENAVASCKEYFEEHWGEKALKATAVMHRLLNNENNK